MDMRWLKCVSSFSVLHAFVCLSISSCDSHYEEDTPCHTIIAYYACDNDLSVDAYTSIYNMLDGQLDICGQRLVVFADIQGEKPSLNEYYRGENALLRSYDEANSCDISFVKSIIDTIVGLYPSDAFSMIFFSHAYSWYPKDELVCRNKWIGLDESSNAVLEIMDLKDIFPVKFKAIVFDACYCASIELLYQLRDCADYIIASPSETLAYGIPYRTCLNHLYKGNYSAIIRDYVSYYEDLSAPYNTASMTVVNTSRLKCLISVINRVLLSVNVSNEGWWNSAMPLDDTVDNKLFDLLSTFHDSFSLSDYRIVKEVIDNVVVAFAGTKAFNQKYLDCCGISCSVPMLDNSYYKSLDYSIDIGIVR